MKKTLFLHIGCEKCGSTSIQDFLSRNYRLLAQKGFLIPFFLGGTNHVWGIFLATFAPQRDISVSYLPAPVRYFFRFIVIYKRLLFFAWLKLIRPKKVIISSEFFQSRYSTLEELQSLHDCFSEYFDSIKILLYIRNPLSSAVSLYSTAVKSGASEGFPSPPSSYYVKSLMHKRTVSDWSYIFGADNIYLKLFEDDFLNRNGVLHSFTSFIGIDSLEGFSVSASRSNLSLNPQELALYRALNRLNAGSTNSYVLSHKAFDLLQDYSLNRLIPSREYYDTYENHFKESQDWIIRNYFNDRDLSDSKFVNSYDRAELPMISSWESLDLIVSPDSKFDKSFYRRRNLVFSVFRNCIFSFYRFFRFFAAEFFFIIRSFCVLIR